MNNITLYIEQNIYSNDPYYIDEEFVDIDFLDDVKPGTYFISNYGKVFSTFCNRLLIPIISTFGYYYVSLGANNHEFNHRLVALAFVPGRTEIRNCINHINGIKTWNYYRNLEWCSKAENNTHAYATHLNNYIGENCKQARITNEQAEQICQLLEKNIPIKDILDIMGMEYTNNNYEIIRSIRKGTAWTSISCKYKMPNNDYIYGSITLDEARMICECLEKGMDVPQIYETVFNKKYINISECDKYNSIMNIKKRRSYKSISNNYKF